MGRILDVGCATGYFLEAAKNNGFQPFGVELSAYSAQLAQSKFGEAAVFNGILEQAPFAEKSFSVIAMSDLIEHVRYPIMTLKKAHQLLEDKGVLMIMTPNTDSPSHKRMKEKWTHYKLEHFYYFNKASITKAAKEAGFEVVHYEHAKKSMNIDYFHTQLNVYKNKYVTPVINLVYKILPTWAVQKIFNIKLGEMVVILKKQS